MPTIYDRNTGQVVGTTGPVQNAIYRNGWIVGFMSTNHTTQPVVVRPPSTTLPVPRPPSSPFTSRTAVNGTEDVRNLPSGTTATNRAATTPTQTPAFDPQQYVQSWLESYFAERAGQGTKPPTTEAEIRDWVTKNFGYMAAYLNDPEIGPILRQAATDQVTSQEVLFGRLWNTNWWKTTDAVARQWDYLERADPAEAQRQVDAQIATIRNRASTLGVDLGGDIDSFARQALRAGWSDAQVTDYLLQRVQSQQSYTEGDLGAIQQQVRQVAASYLMDISDATSSWYARRIASGELTLDAAAATFGHQARARFPWLAEQIDKGVTPADYFLPMRDRIARMLEKNPEDIDPMDPKWLRLMEIPDAKTGQMRGATEYEIQGAVRQMSDWYETNSTKELYTNLTMGLAQKFGVI